MENASKALIIAGAVLLSILIIAIGMAIYNGAAGNVESAASGMTQQDIQAYNGRFENYIGTNIRGSQVKSLISLLNTTNQANSNDGIARPPIAFSTNIGGTLTPYRYAADWHYGYGYWVCAEWCKY